MKLEIENGVLKKIHMLYFGDDDIKDIVIPYGVTKIGYQAFASDRHQIDSITIPDTVTEIDDGAFWGGVQDHKYTYPRQCDLNRKRCIFYV